ncbi:proton-conducting transporter membrane subunit [Pontibacter sp. HSC-36F09]|uniref:proton-conducting transporter transmembrane domain-containing protein n=1 Tax=Pontibacter sp. HSC-36F09 TaxID=2910966 RepID=UPI0020A0EAC4|nr:proton-conducting transporter membrane subunit [Pontibacter sp. HSC-36F09]MCP2044991.1 multicomponent Na+:H+ antiporter subunit D [Pontibacter sp. HSC-36F09]
MNHLLIMLPILIPLYGAILSLFFWRSVRAQQFVGIMAQVCLLIASFMLLFDINENGIRTTQVGSWPAPYGITLVADLFSAMIVISGSITGMAVYLFSIKGLDKARQTFGYYPVLLVLQLGVSGACLTGDLFNLFVWFEVLLICCFVLIALGGTKPQLEGAIKYVTINFLATNFLLAGIGVVYGTLGSLNLAELAVLVRTPAAHPALINMAGMFFLIAFGIKAAIFPLFFWLPASYHTPPIAISAFIAGIITKVGMYALIRLFTLIFVTDQDLTIPLFTVLAGFTMVLGVLGAASQNDFRKILSFHIVSQIGYMLMGLALFTPLAIAGSIYFIIHNILVKTNLFLISGVVAHRHGTFALKKLGGVYLQQPLLSVLFFISAFSLAGIPPFSGFWGKFMLAKAGFEIDSFVIVLVSLAVSLMTIFSMTKIWNEVFWKKKPESDPLLEVMTEQKQHHNRLLYLPVVIMTVFILFIGLYAEPVVAMAQLAAEQLLNSELYINAVLKR